MYSILVKIDGFESRRKSAGLLHVVMGFFLIAKGADYYRYLKFDNFLYILPVLAVASFSLFYGFFRRRIDPDAIYNFKLRLMQLLSFFVLGVIMTIVGNSIDYFGLFMFAFVCLLLLFSERKVFQDTIIILDDKGIKIPGYYKDHLIPWQSLSNVTIREDFITLFHVIQKYLQFQVMQTLSPLELAKMNSFCTEQIERAAVAAETNS